MTASQLLCAFVIYSIILHNVGTLNIYYREKRFFEQDKCHGVQATLEKVLTCPENDAIILERVSRKKCDSLPHCQKEPLVYHCVRFEGKLVEVCSPKRQIPGHYCTVLEEGIGRVTVDLFNPCPECPCIYSSDESLKYSTCVQTTMKTATFQTSTEQTNVVSALNEAYGSPTNETFGTTNFKGTTLNGLHHTRKTENDNRIDVHVMILMVTGVIIIVGLIVCCFVKRTFKREITAIYKPVI